MLDVTVTEARRHFGRLLKTVQDEHVQILRRGEVAGFVISANEYQKLVASAAQRDESGPAADQAELPKGRM